jgi:hypothetical protein
MGFCADFFGFYHGDCYARTVGHFMKSYEKNSRLTITEDGVPT